MSRMMLSRKTLVLHTMAAVLRLDDEEDGLSTAELLGNAALGVAALVVIWAALQALGLEVVAWIGAQLGI